MNAAATTPLKKTAFAPRNRPTGFLLDESEGFLGLGRSLTFPFPQYRADDKYDTVYFDEGEGRTLVFVHGLGANATHWEPLVRALAPKCRVVGLDLVGLGWSLKPDVRFTVDLMRDHLLDFMAARGIRRATVIGHSMGGAVSMAATVARPDLFDALVLISAAGVAPLPRWMQVAAPLALKRQVLFPILGLGASFILDNVFVDAPEDNPHVEWFYESALRDDRSYFNLLEFARVCESLCVDVANRDYSKHFPSMHLPVLAIWGDHDKLSSVGGVLKRLGDLPRLRTVMLKDTGHMPMVERPDQTLFQLERFLRNPP